MASDKQSARSITSGLAPGDESQTVLAFPCDRERIASAKRFRSTWIVSSLETLRHGGHFDRYRALLQGQSEPILTCVAGVWLPMAVAREHYLACDALDLTGEEQTAMSQGPGGKVRRSWYAPLIAAAQQPGANPWSILSLLHRMWLRGADGGAVGVFRVAPNQARVEYVGCELFDIPYFRRAVGVALATLTEHVCERPVVQCLAWTSSGESRYSVSWH